MILGTPECASERLFVLILLQLLHWVADALPHTVQSAHPLRPSSRARAAWKKLQQCVVPPQLACICLGPGEEKGLLKEGLTKQDLPKESVSKGDLPREDLPEGRPPRGKAFSSGPEHGSMPGVKKSQSCCGYGESSSGCCGATGGTGSP